MKQAVVRPKKYYYTVSFSGLAESISARGGEDAFVSGITYAVTQAVRRAGARFEEVFLRGDGTGRITNVKGTATNTAVVSVNDTIPFRPNQVIVFLSNTTGALVDGPVTVVSRDNSASTITVNTPVTAAIGDGIYYQSEQNGSGPIQEITALGLPALVNNTGQIYGLSRVVYPGLQSKVIDAVSTALDESMLRRLRTRILIDSAAESLDGYAMVSHLSQFDRYTEIALPFRRFFDNRLELGADVQMTTFEGRGWMVSWAALRDELYLMNLAAIERGVVRPFGIDERVNMTWLPGQDAFMIAMKAYFEYVGRSLNETGAIRNLTYPSW